MPRSITALPFDFKIVRSCRKTLSVCVDHKARVIVRAPLRLKNDRIFAFLQEKNGWIEEKIMQIENGSEEKVFPKVAADGAVFPWIGKSVTVRLFEARDKKSRTPYRLGDVIYVANDRPQERLIGFLKGEAKEYLEQEVKKFASLMQASYASVSVNGARTRWGSCSFDNRLHFSYRLMFAEERVIEYVVIHELAHTFEKNHSAKFWAIVQKYEPFYKERRNYLKAHSYYMDAF